MTFYEILNITGLVLKIYTIAQEGFKSAPNTRNTNQEVADSESFRGLGLCFEQGDSVFAISEEVENKNKLAGAISTTTLM